MRARLLPLFVALPLLLVACPDKAQTPSDESADETFVAKIPAIPEGARSLPVTVSDLGYEPNTLEAKPKETVVVAFTRTSKSECGRYVQVEGTDTQAELPLNETVNIPIEMPESGEVTFACGMNMMHGIIKVVAVGGPPADAAPALEEAPAEEKAG